MTARDDLNVRKGTQGFIETERDAPAPSPLGRSAIGTDIPTLRDMPIESVLDGYEPNQRFSIPQANDLEKIVHVTDVVEAGVDTSDGIADALDLHQREGGYYANAAGYLGLVERDESDTLHTYVLTDLGREMHSRDPESRSALVSQMVALVPEMEVYEEGGTEALAEHLEKWADLQDATARRRADCMASWHTKALNRASLKDSIVDSNVSIDNLRMGLNRSFEQREAEKARRSSVAAPKRGATCPSCFTEMSLTGACENCD